MLSLKSTLLEAVLLSLVSGAPTTVKYVKRDVDTTYPYNGPEIPIGDWVDATVNGNGKGFIRLVEDPAVTPGESSHRDSTFEHTC